MYYQILLGMVAVVVTVFIYNNSGLADPAKTMLAAIFLSLAVVVFLDDSNEPEKSEDEYE